MKLIMITLNVNKFPVVLRTKFQYTITPNRFTPDVNSLNESAEMIPLKVINIEYVFQKLFYILFLTWR